MGIDQNTGEVTQYRNPGGLTDEELLEYQPLSPGEIEQVIFILTDRLEKAVPVMKELWENRYAAESAYIKARATAMLMSTQTTVTRQRAEADIAALPALLEFQQHKAILHAAEELQKALTAKLYGYLNINKASTAAFQGTRR